MKKIIFSLAIVFSTATILVSCGGKKEESSANATMDEGSMEETATESEKMGDDSSQNEESTMDKVKDKASEIKEEVKASTSSEQSATEVVDEVLDNSNVEKNSIPNSTATADVSLREKYSKAFGFEGFDIK